MRWLLALMISVNLSTALADDVPPAEPPTATEQPEGCRAEDMPDWAALIRSYPDDVEVLGLFILHRKLCELVGDKSLTEDRASDVFESWRSLLKRSRSSGPPNAY